MMDWIGRINEQIEYLEQAHIRFAQALQMHLSSDQIWLPDAWKTSEWAKEQVGEHLTRLLFSPKLASNQSTHLPGVVLATPELVSALEAINQARTDFKTFMHQIKQEQGRTAYLKWVAATVHPKQISLIQSFRQFRIEGSEVEAVSLSWVTQDTASAKIDYAKARKLIVSTLADNLEIQQMVLNHLDIVASDGCDLYFKKPISAHIQANLRPKNSKRYHKHKMHSPVFLTQTYWPRLPKKPFLLEPTLKSRKKRSDIQLNWQKLYKGVPIYYRLS